MQKSKLVLFYRKYFKPIKLSINKPKNDTKLAESIDYIRSLRAVHKGGRCFIVGNGPSLRADDLDKIKNEICFASNRIYNVFDKTAWRPTYYCLSDQGVIKQSHKEIEEKVAGNKFVCINEAEAYPEIKGAQYLNQIWEDYYPNEPKFSEDIAKCVYSGETVTYICIQIAAYMGLKEIYLIGIDHSYSVNRNPDGTITRSDNIKDHFSENDKVASMPQTQKMDLAYEAAKQYADANGIKIYNATRGGKLEVFERVDFDSLFERTEDK